MEKLFYFYCKKHFTSYGVEQDDFLVGLVKINNWAKPKLRLTVLFVGFVLQKGCLVVVFNLIQQ